MITCFETMEMCASLVFALDAHVERLERCAGAMGLAAFDRQMLHRAIDAVRPDHPLPGCHNPGHPYPGTVHRFDGSMRLRASWDDSGTSTVVTGPLVRPTGPAVVVLDMDHPIDSRSPFAGMKVNAYADVVATLVANGDADEVLLVNETGQLTGGAHSNLFIAIDDALMTPALSSGCRDGVTRELLIDLLRSTGATVEECVVTPADLKHAEGLFLTSTGRGVQEIGWLDDWQCPRSPLTSLASHALTTAREDERMWS